MVKTTVYLNPETALALRQLARAQGRSQAEVIREALELYASRATRPKPGGIGKYRSGRSDVSERAEELLREKAKKKR
jgi:hypothetical protein